MYRNVIILPTGGTYSHSLWLYCTQPWQQFPIAAPQYLKQQKSLPVLQSRQHLDISNEIKLFKRKESVSGSQIDQYEPKQEKRKFPILSETLV